MNNKKICPLCLEKEVGKDTNGLCTECFDFNKKEELENEEDIDILKIQ